MEIVAVRSPWDRRVTNAGEWDPHGATSRRGGRSRCRAPWGRVRPSKGWY